MTIKYPNGKEMDKSLLVKKEDKRKSKYKSEDEKIKEHISKANMGMSFENDVNKSCDFYRLNDIALIYKRPTPIRIVKMNSEFNKITEAYFSSKSTTDYVGLYKGKYIDFECKETIHEVVPYSMIREQQYRHLEKVIEMKGIAFFLVSFKKFDEVFLVNAKYVLQLASKEHNGYKHEFFLQNGIKVERSYSPPIKFIDAIEKEFKDLLL